MITPLYWTVLFGLFFQCLPINHVWAADDPALVPKSGQTISYATGDDGNPPKGVSWPTPRFTDNLDGTVTDNMTNLIWLQQANCFGFKTWAEALTSANDLAEGTCGLTDGSIAQDWRLPNRRELESLIDYGQFNPALPNDHPFIGVQTFSYWSSTTRIDYTSFAWRVDLNFGNVYSTDKTSSSVLLPVQDKK